MKNPEVAEAEALAKDKSVKCCATSASMLPLLYVTSLRRKGHAKLNVRKWVS